MTPTNSNRATPCTSTSTSTCTTWSGQSIPALGIVSGQTMTDTTYKIACAVVDTIGELDLSDMDLTCLIDKTPILPENKNIRLILQMLLDNQCSLLTLIDKVSGADQAPPTVAVNMKCLTVYDAFGNAIPQDFNTTLQSMINQICTNQTGIANLKATTISLQNQIDNIPPPTPYVEPSIVTCITPTAKPTSVQVPIAIQDYCNYKIAVGQILDVQSAIARQPTGLNTSLGTVDGWVLNPQNLAQSDTNQWLTIANLLSRVNNIESNCCKVTCKDIQLVLLINVGSDGESITVTFSTVLGTNIPNGFTDTGASTITITDQNNLFVTYPILVTEDQSQGPFSFNGLDTSAPLTASVNAVLSSGTLTCEKCIGKQFVPTSSCPVCLITGTGTTGLTTIVYTVPGQTTIQTLLIAPGSTGYIQRNASLIGIDSTGDSGVTSTCINLNAPPYVCVNIEWATSGGTSTSVTWENYNQDIQATALGIGGIEYPLVNAYKGDPNVIATAIASAVPPGLVKVITTTANNTVGVRYSDTVVMKVPQNLVSSTYLTFKVADYGPLRALAQTCSTCCPDNNTNVGGGTVL